MCRSLRFKHYWRPHMSYTWYSQPASLAGHNRQCGMVREWSHDTWTFRKCAGLQMLYLQLTIEETWSASCNSSNTDVSSSNLQSTCYEPRHVMKRRTYMRSCPEETHSLSCERSRFKGVGPVLMADSKDWKRHSISTFHLHEDDVMEANTYRMWDDWANH